MEMSWDSSVGIVTGYSLNGQGLIPGRGKRFVLFTVSRPTLGPTQPPLQWILEALSPGVKWPGCEADYLLPSIAEVKNGGTTLPLHPYVFMAWCLIN
jgi:hypothetical protein